MIFMSMKEAFDIFFEEMTDNFLKKRGKKPFAYCDEKNRPTGLFLMETLNAGGYAEWKPKLQDHPVSFDNIEQLLGFSIHPQIKSYFSTYWFLPLEATYHLNQKEIDFCIIGINQYSSLETIIKDNFNFEGAHYLSDHNYFLLGTYCNIDGNDSYLVEVNNETGEVMAVEVQEKKSMKLADSIEELLKNMKGIWK